MKRSKVEDGRLVRVVVPPLTEAEIRKHAETCAMCREQMETVKYLEEAGDIPRRADVQQG